MKKRNNVVKLSITAVALAPLILLAAGCNSGGDGSPTTPATPNLVLSEAVVMVDDQAVNGQTLSPGFGAGSTTRFEAHLGDGSGPALGHTVWVEFDRPMGQGRGTGHHQGRFQLYDDGTHGDQVPGDGLYCFEDFAAEFGCHGPNAQAGEYHYEFWGEHQQDGHHSNRFGVTVALSDG
ncbi:MAG: hypothetical protein WBH85_11410 [Thermoanaerobaculia bacterium]